VIAGAGLNVWRVAYWKTDGIHSPRGFQSGPEKVDGRRVYWARSVARVEVFNQRWRPLRVTLTLRGPDEVPAGTRVRVSVDNRPAEIFDVHPSWSKHSFVITEPGASDGRLWLLLETPTIQPGVRRGFGFGELKTAPILAPRPVVIHALAGAALGALAWLLLVPRRWPRDRSLDDPLAAGASIRQGSTLQRASPSSSPGPGRFGLVGVALVLFLYFSCWALIKPPYQTGDEPQHHLRTTSILQHPWFADPSRFALDGRYLNPLAYQPPGAIAKLPFNGDQRLTAEEIAQVKATPWIPDGLPRELEPFERVNASYPTLFYLTLFAIAQPLTSALDLTPYQSAFIYRFVTAGLAALLWTAVFVALVRTTVTQAIAGWILALIVLNPMLAFLSSGVTPDAASMPLSALAMLAVWRVLAVGTHRGWALACLLAAALVKPSAGPLFLSLLCGVAAVWLLDPARARTAQAVLTRRTPGIPTGDISARTGHALLVVARAGLIAAVVFYLWSPLLFAGQDEIAAHDGLGDFLVRRLHELGLKWIEFWGKLGWLDYEIGGMWYLLLFVLVLINAACVFWRPRRVPAGGAFVLFVATVFLVFAALTVAGEFLYLSQAGYTLQGRYLLPVALGLIAPILWHRVPPARYALVAGVVVVNLLLAQQTVTRYYHDGWSGVRQAFPFVLPF
jgi:Predicted membrane protein (DUF2142)